MFTLHKYVIISVIKYFIIIQIVVLSIYLSIDFVEKANNLTNMGLTLGNILILFLYKIPFIIVQITPIGFLLSIITTFSFMGKSNELIALQSCGISIKILLKSTVTLGFVGSLVVILLSEATNPWISGFQAVSNGFENNACKNEDIWVKKPGKVIHIKKYSYTDRKMEGITINYFDKNSKLLRRLDAEKGLLGKKQCFLEEVIDQNLDISNGFYNSIFHNSFDIKIDITEEDFKIIGEIFNEMGLLETYKYAHKIEFQGYNAERYWVDYYNKMSFYFVCLLFNLVGAVIVFRNPKRNVVLNISYGILLVFIYWVLNCLCISLGYIGVISPSLSAWTVTLIFLCVTAYILLKIE